MGFIVAIDGPAGSGKGTITKILAKECNLLCIDTGAIYRMITLRCLNNHIDIDNEEAIIKEATNAKLEIKHQDNEQVFCLDNVDVSQEIRSEEVSEHVPIIAKIPEVREVVLALQRSFAQDHDIIMEGRDITTVVFPNANVKIYLDASMEERAKRRYKQNLEKGLDLSYEETLKEMQKRDEMDKSRSVSALKIAPDAIVIDTTNMNIEEAKNKIKAIIDAKIVENITN